MWVCPCAERREGYVRIEEAVHVELCVLVMDSQNTMEYITRALTLSSRALAEAALQHQQETVKLVCASLCVLRA